MASEAFKCIMCPTVLMKRLLINQLSFCANCLQIIVAVPSVAALLLLPHFWGLPAVWVGLTLIMSLRLGVGLLR